MSTNAAPREHIDPPQRRPSMNFNTNANQKRYFDLIFERNFDMPALHPGVHCTIMQHLDSIGAVWRTHRFIGTYKYHIDSNIESKLAAADEDEAKLIALRMVRLQNDVDAMTEMIEGKHLDGNGDNSLDHVTGQVANLNLTDQSKQPILPFSTITISCLNDTTDHFWSYDAQHQHGQRVDEGSCVDQCH